MSFDHLEWKEPGAVAALADSLETSGKLPKPDPEEDRCSPRTAQAKWDAAHPKARWAHKVMHWGLRRGLIEREPCIMCGNPKVDGHHGDYDDPLTVIWLCRRHHQKIHAALRKQGGG